MMSTGFSPPESSSFSTSSSSQMVSSTEQLMGERAAAMTTVVEHQGSASRGDSRQSSRESSRSSSERKGVKKSNINRKGKPKALTVSTPGAHPASPNVGVVATAPGLDSACAGFQPGFHDDDEFMNPHGSLSAQGHIDQRSIQQHHHVDQTFVDQRSVHQHVHIEDQQSRREADEARATALNIQAQVLSELTRNWLQNAAPRLQKRYSLACQLLVKDGWALTLAAKRSSQT